VRSASYERLFIPSRTETTDRIIWKKNQNRNGKAVFKLIRSGIFTGFVPTHNNNNKQNKQIVGLSGGPTIAKRPINMLQPTALRLLM
jgi:hypothetical protein